MRLLWIKTSPLHPLTRGGDLRTFHVLRHLHQRHQVTFVGMTADAGQKDGALRSGEYASHSAWAHEPKASLQMSKWRFLAGALANLPSSLPYAVARFRSAKLSRQVARLISLQQHDVVVSDFLFPAASLPWELKARTQAPWVLFQHNVESMIWKRRAEGKTRARIWDFIIRPPDMGSRYDAATFNVERRLFQRELVRVVEFCQTAENGDAALQTLRDLRRRYHLLDV